MDDGSCGTTDGGHAVGIGRVLEATPAATAVFDGEGSVIELNAAARELFGADVGSFEVASRRTYDRDGEPLSVDGLPHATVMRTGEPVENHLLRLEADGTGSGGWGDSKSGSTGSTTTADQPDRWLSVSANPIRNEDGAVERVVATYTDVTDQRERAERHRRRHESAAAELERVHEQITDGFLALNEDWEVVDINARAEELLGVSTEVLGENVWDLHPEVAETEFERQYRAVAADGEPRTFEAYYPPTDTWFEEHVYPDDDGVRVYFRDVGDRRQLVETLRRRDRRITRLVKNVPGMVYRCRNEPDWPMEFVSDAAEEITGYDPEELTGGDVSYGEDVVHEDDRGRLWETIQREMTDNDPFDTTYRIVTADDEVRWVRESGRGVFEDGELVALEGVIEDVTDAKQREKDLELFRQLLDHSTDSVFVVDPETGAILDVNDTACRERGYTREELISRNVLDVEVTFEDTAERDAFFENLRDEEEVTFEGVHRRKDGSTYPVEANISHVDLGDEYVVSVVRDATEKRAFERTLSALHDATLELHDRDTTAAVSEAVVDAVTEVIGLPRATVYTHDDELGLLVPRATDTDDGPESAAPMADPVSVDADHPVADAFATDESRTRVVAVGSPDGGDLRDAVCVSVGDHGVIVAGADEPDQVDDRHRRLVEVLATNAGTAYDRIERERYLRDAKERLEAATLAGAVGTFEWNVDTDEMFTGDAFARLYGVDPDAAREGVTLEKFIDAIHPEDRGRVQEQIDEAVENCGEFTSEYRVRNAEGETRWVVARGHVERGPDGERTFPGAVTDITERKRAEIALSRHRDQLETLFDILPVGVTVAEADGELVRANDVAREIWGGAVADADSIAEYDRFQGVWADSGDPVEPDEWTLARVINGETVREPDVFEIQGFDDERRIIGIRGRPIFDDDGEVVRGVVTMTDITERREYRRKLEESNERLEQFAHATSHDLQEPLRMVSSYLQLIERRYANVLDDDAEEFLEFAVDGAERMKEMIDGLLEYSRIETRGDPLTPTDLDDVVEDVREDLKIRIEETDADISVSSLPTVQADASQLRQVFQNLLSNALKYNGEEPPVVRIDAERAGDEWRITVADEGIGIDPAHADHVFEVFQRLHTHDEHSGTGIGLALCQRIVERHGGEMWVDSEAGEGATFGFTVPAVDGHQETA